MPTTKDNEQNKTVIRICAEMRNVDDGQKEERK